MTTFAIYRKLACRNAEYRLWEVMSGKDAAQAMRRACLMHNLGESPSFGGRVRRPGEASRQYWYCAGWDMMIRRASRNEIELKRESGRRIADG